MKKLKLFEAFAGYGGASYGLQRAKISHQTIGYSEIDRFAIEFYENNHPGILNYGDITKIDPKDIPDFDIFTGGFPLSTIFTGWSWTRRRRYSRDSIS